MQIPTKGKLLCVVLGSSVAAEYGGWTYMLADSLKDRGWEIINAATPGYDTASCKETLEDDIQSSLQGRNPNLVIVGLSLMNEGLMINAKSAYTSFQKGMKDIIHTVTQKYNAKVVLGGVYPCNGYSYDHYQYLKAMKTEMETWGIPLLDFLSATDDGKGHWKKGTYRDAMHPNDKGHRLMFEAIDLILFDKIRDELLKAHPNENTSAKY